MQIIAVINYKGGVGKTTTTANLAAELASRGQRILLVDLDPQASLTFSLVTPDEWERDLAGSKTIKSWFDAFTNKQATRLADLIVAPSRLNTELEGNGQLDLIASHLGLINVDLELATELGGATLKQSKLNYLRVHRRLADGLAQIEEDDTYDIVLIDCPPNFNVVTKTAIVASDFVLIPAKPDYLSTLGIDYLQRNLKELVQSYNEFAKLGEMEAPEIDPRVLGIVFTMVQIYGGVPISTIRPFIAKTRALGVPVFQSYIRENKTLFADAPQYGVPVILNSYSNGSHSDVVSGLRAFVDEFETLLAQQATP